MRLRPGPPPYQAMVDQLDTIRDLINAHSATYDRLALLLIDNAAEIVMWRTIQVIFHYRQRYSDDLRARLRIPKARRWQGFDEELEEVRRKAISKRRREDIERNFHEKLKLLVEENELHDSEAEVLGRLHKYRNETYHDDNVRDVTLRTSVLIYVTLTCALFERCPYPVITKGSPGGDGPEMPKDVINRLLVEIDFSEEMLPIALSEFLVERLDEIEEMIEFIAEEAGEASQDFAIKLACMGEVTRPPTKKDIYSVDAPYTYDDLGKWRVMAQDVAKASDRLGAFSMFAEAERLIEPLESKIAQLVAEMDQSIQDETDRQLGN